MSLWCPTEDSSCPSCTGSGEFEIVATIVGRDSDRDGSERGVIFFGIEGKDGVDLGEEGVLDEVD